MENRSSIFSPRKKWRTSSTKSGRMSRSSSSKDSSSDRPMASLLQPRGQFLPVPQLRAVISLVQPSAHSPCPLHCDVLVAHGGRPIRTLPDESSRSRARPATGMANRRPDPKNKFPGPISRDPMLLFRKADAKNHTDLPRPLNSNDHGHTGQQPTKYSKVARAPLVALSCTVRR